MAFGSTVPTSNSEKRQHDDDVTFGELENHRPPDAG